MLKNPPKRGRWLFQPFRLMLLRPARRHPSKPITSSVRHLARLPLLQQPRARRIRYRSRMRITSDGCTRPSSSMKLLSNGRTMLNWSCSICHRRPSKLANQEGRTVSFPFPGTSRFTINFFSCWLFHRYGVLRSINRRFGSGYHGERMRTRSCHHLFVGENSNNNKLRHRGMCSIAKESKLDTQRISLVRFFFHVKKFHLLTAV